MKTFWGKSVIWSSKEEKTHETCLALGRMVFLELKIQANAWLLNFKEIWRQTSFRSHPSCQKFRSMATSNFNPFRLIQASIRKFWSKLGFENQPKNLDPRVPDRNFCRGDHFRYNPSTLQKFRSATLGSRFFGLFSELNFDQNFRMDACIEKG